MTCKDCDRRTVCRYYTQWANIEQVETNRCQYFKNKADVIEILPCGLWGNDCAYWDGKVTMEGVSLIIMV